MLIPDAVNMPEKMGQFRICSRSEIRQRCLQFFRQNRLLPDSHRGWHALAQLLRRQWFERLWTFQEAVLPGADHVIVNCGTRSVSLKCLTRAAFCLGSDMDDLPIGRSKLDVVDKVQSRLQQSLPVPLIELLENVQFFSATDQADRIYALLGIHREEPSMPMQSILVDYTLPTIEIYIMVTRSIIAARGSLLISTNAPGQEHGSVPGLPSWVPDFSATPTMPSLEYINPNGNNFNACQKRHHTMPVAASGNLLTVRGRIVAVVESRIIVKERNVRLTRDENKNILTDYIIPLLYHRLRSVPGARSEEQIMIAIMRGLTIDGYLRRRESQQNSIMQASSWSDDYLVRFCSQILRPAEPQMSAHEFQQRLSIFTLDTMLQGRGYAVVDRTFAVVPVSVKCGDQVAILHGLTVPVALRKENGRYKLLGSCYIEGMMQGERVDWAETSADTIVLE